MEPKQLGTDLYALQLHLTNATRTQGDELYNVINNSMRAERKPLLFAITTAGF